MEGSRQVLEEGPREAVCRENGFSASAVEAPIIIKEDSKCVAEKVSSFLDQCTNVLLQSAKHRDQRTASQLIVLRSVTSFHIKNLRPYIRSLADTENVTINSKTGLMKNDGFCRIPVRGGSGKKIATHYL